MIETWKQIMKELQEENQYLSVGIDELEKIDVAEKYVIEILKIQMRNVHFSEEEKEYLLKNEPARICLKVFYISKSYDDALALSLLYYDEEKVRKEMEKYDYAIFRLLLYYGKDGRKSFIKNIIRREAEKVFPELKVDEFVAVKDKGAYSIFEVWLKNC